MRTLPIWFKRNGFEFEQVERNEHAAIYRKRHGEGTWSFEVVVVRQRKEKEVFGVTFEAGEFYPSSEEWGVFGWTYVDLAGSKHRLGTLIAPKTKSGTTT